MDPMTWSMLRTVCGLSDCSSEGCWVRDSSKDMEAVSVGQERGM